MLPSTLRPGPASSPRLVSAAILAGLAAAGQPDPAAAQQSCSRHPLAVQVLGSGGPFAGGTRASTGYLVWNRGRAVVLIDAGGGVFLRFGEAGARLDDLSLLAITHLHPDHVADLPALLWLSEQARRKPLAVSGPSGGHGFPAFDRFLERLFDSTGAFPILGGTLGRPGQGVRLLPMVLDVGAVEPAIVMSDGELEVAALPVPHGSVPSVGYRVRIGDRRLVFGSDQNGRDRRFVELASDADVLVMHLAVSQSAPEPLAQMHARPATVGEVANAARAKRLVLSHMIGVPSGVVAPERFSLTGLEDAVREVRERYHGPIELATDLLCIPVR